MEENNELKEKIQFVKKIPVTVITGFLGSGKTTLLSYILTNQSHGKRLAVIENEFAAPIGIHNEVKSGLEHASCVVEIMETQNGCLCCSGKDNFIQLLFELIQNKDKFDYLLIETTGMADPTFTQAFFLSKELKEHFQLDGIITLVDASNAYRHLQKQDQPPREAREVQIINETIEQIAFADRIIINKIDLVDEEQLKELRETIYKINSSAEIKETKFSQVDLKFILDIESFNIDRCLKQDPGFLDFRPFRQHDQSIGSLSLMGTGDVDIENFKIWLTRLLQEKGREIYRCKGVISSQNNPTKYVFQGVHSSFEVHTQDKWERDEKPMVKLVFIGKNLNAKEILESWKKEMKTPLYLANPSSSSSPLGLLLLISIILILLYPSETFTWIETHPFLFLVLAICVRSYYLRRRI